MFFDQDIKGDQTEPGVVCLTYDDGPGWHTLELGRYLYEQQVAATFFVVGQHIERYPDVLPALHRWGHLIGNHTYSHPGLVSFAKGGGDVVAELARTDELIRPYKQGKTIFFRAPYGNWRDRAQPDGPDCPHSLVAERLRASSRFADYVGPINWDIVAEDWECWRQGVSARECARRYLEEAERLGRGILLMHDSSEEAAMRPRNRTMHMTKFLVPWLRQRGFRFARLDELPQVRSAMQVG